MKDKDLTKQKNVQEQGKNTDQAQELEKKIKGLREKLKRCKKEKDDYLSGWKRARADIINYKKEEKERMEGFLKLSVQEFIFKLLPLLDDLERAEERLSEKTKELKEVKGLLQIRKKLKDILEKEGLEEVEVLGKSFDPRYAEAIDVMEEKGLDEEKVVEVIEKGYKLHGRVIRPAKVIVSKIKTQPQQQS